MCVSVRLKPMLADQFRAQCKSSNILINKKGVCKVGDFGLARVKSTTRSVLRSTVGTCQYQSPELWHPKPRYDYKVDVYSCSMVFWEMLSGWSSERVGAAHRRGSVRPADRYSNRNSTHGRARTSTGSTKTSVAKVHDRRHSPSKRLGAQTSWSCSSGCGRKIPMKGRQ